VLTSLMLTGFLSSDVQRLSPASAAAQGRARLGTDRE